MNRNFQIIITGKVNARGLKLQTMMLAKKYHIAGMVTEKANCILIDAEGDHLLIERFISACEKMIRSEASNKLTVKENPLAYYDEFIIN